MKLSRIGEFQVIRRFVSRLPKFSSKVVIGPGDDCAVIRIGRARHPPKADLLLLTTDMLIEGVHFRREWATPEAIGAKAMLVNLSDIAAMGGVPRFALVSVGLPRTFTVEETDRLFRGIRRTAQTHHVALVGGDTNASQRLILSIMLIGEPYRGRFLTRGGARVEDSIYVTGSLGDSSLGLEALKKRKRSGYEKFIKRHLFPPSRIAVGKRLAQNRSVHSLIDLSDGLVGDLGHILEESGVGAEVMADAIPVSRDFMRRGRRLGVDPVLLKLGGGEDYELLFTASPRVKIPEKIDGVSVTKIGRILPKGEGFRLIDSKGDRPLRPLRGFRHF